VSKEFKSFAMIELLIVFEIIIASNVFLDIKKESFLLEIQQYLQLRLYKEVGWIG
jgi:hypothetical protein